MKFKAVKYGNWFKFDNIDMVHKYLSAFPQDKLLDVDISEPFIQRNTSQNALLHTIFRQLDPLIGNNNVDLTKWQILIDLGYYKILEDLQGNILKFPLSTSKLNKKDFAELVGKLDMWAWENYQVSVNRS